MSSCEKCWRDSRGDTDLYRTLLQERACSPEEQAGPEAKLCPECGRWVIHQITSQCMAGCGKAHWHIEERK